jgi:hypothetical protein
LAAGVDYVHRTLAWHSKNIVVFVPLNMLLKPPRIQRWRFMMDTAKIEARATLLHAPASQHDCEALAKREALKALSIKLYIVKYLNIRRLLKKGRREGSDTSFDLATDMGRAVRVGGPMSGHSNGKLQHQRISKSKIRLGSDSELKSQMAIKWQDCEICQETLIQISTVKSRQEPIAESDFAESTAACVPIRRHSRLARSHPTLMILR